MMRFSLRSRFLLTTFLVLGLFTSSQAMAGLIGAGQYQLLDHPDGEVSGTHPYGIRVDSLGLLFSTELNGANVILDWDGGSTASITGTVYSSDGDLWTVNYDLTGVVADGAGEGFRAAAGTGTLTDPSLVVTTLTGRTGNGGDAASVFTFLGDGHRLEEHPSFGNSDSPVARGWLEPAGSVDDWLVRAVPVPEPGTSLLFGLGLLGLSSVRPRR